MNGFLQDWRVSVGGAALSVMLSVDLRSVIQVQFWLTLWFTFAWFFVWRLLFSCVEYQSHSYSLLWRICALTILPLITSFPKSLDYETSRVQRQNRFITIHASTRRSLRSGFTFLKLPKPLLAIPQSGVFLKHKHLINDLWTKLREAFDLPPLWVLAR